MAHSTEHEDVSDEFDLIVVGAGPVGENVADRAAQAGLRTVIIEHELVGGECSYWACMPSKALLRSGHALYAAQHVGGVTGGALDTAQVLARRDRFASDWSDDGQVEWLRSANIALIRGHGRLDGERQVAVEDDSGQVRRLRARYAVAIATGSDATIPDIPGLRDAEPWTNREVTAAQEIPSSLIIIGGGAVGTEMAAAYASLGCTVTLVARGGLLSSMEPFAGDMVRDRLRADGVRVLTDTSVTSVHRDAHGVTAVTDSGEQITANELLIATGRAPRTTTVGAETVGLTPGEWLRTDDTLRVDGFDWLYAVGDVNHRSLLTHQGKYQARAAGDTIVARAQNLPIDDAPWGRNVATADHAAIPQVVFTTPEVASVGLTEKAARDAALDISVTDLDFGSVAGAALRQDDYEGRARMIVDKTRNVVVGVTFVSPDASEQLHAATIAVVGEVPLSRLWHAVPAYPTTSEIWLRLLEKHGRASADRESST